MSYRTSSLFHYTKSLEILGKILKGGLKPNYREEDLSYTTFSSDVIELKIDIPMISFCDIPLSKTSKHTNRYGKFAIGLTKEWAKPKKNKPNFICDQ